MQLRKGVPYIRNQENARQDSMKLSTGRGIVVVAETLENT